jgi:hypothetical protein
MTREEMATLARNAMEKNVVALEAEYEPAEAVVNAMAEDIYNDGWTALVNAGVSKVDAGWVAREAARFYYDKWRSRYLADKANGNCVDEEWGA